MSKLPRVGKALSGTTASKSATSAEAAGSSLTRRKFLVRTALAAGAVSWTNLTLINRARAADTLRILAWPGYDEASSWSNLFLPKFKGKVVVFDWYLPNMSNASLAVFPNNPTPYDITDDQLAKVKDWLMKLPPQATSFSEQNQGLVSALVNEDAIITPYGDMDIEMTVAGYDNFKSVVPKEGSIRWTEAACLCADSKNQELALKWIEYMSSAKVQAKLVYTKGFKARAPNMKVVDFWDADQKKIMHYVPDPANPGKMLVETRIDQTSARG